MYLSTKEAAYVLKLSNRTLEKWRSTGDGPPFRKRGRSVVYLLDDLLVFMKELPTFKNTGEAVLYWSQDRARRIAKHAPIGALFVQQILEGNSPRGSN